MAAVAVVLPARQAEAGSPADRSAAIAHVAWRLTEATVVEWGKTLTVPEGTVVSGFVVESAATSIGNGRFRRGRFQLAGTLFSPDAESRRASARVWHVNAAWAILDPHPMPNVEPEGPYVAGGRLQATLSFNPLDHPGLVNASLSLTNAPPAGGRMVGEGTFSGNQRFEGMLTWKLLERCETVATPVKRMPTLDACLRPGSRSQAVSLDQDAVGGRVRALRLPVAARTPAGTPDPRLPRSHGEGQRPRPSPVQ
jgi:hypothetical protein